LEQFRKTFTDPSSAYTSDGARPQAGSKSHKLLKKVNVCRVWFVSGHDFSRADTLEEIRALAPGFLIGYKQQGLKPILLRAQSARLKSCPDTNRNPTRSISSSGKVCGIRVGSLTHAEPSMKREISRDRNEAATLT
jgi:hypothetical protein